jgi:hypothetical protein
MDVCVRLFYVCVVLCVSRGLATGWSTVQWVLPADNNNNSVHFNSVQFFIIYVPSQQLQGRLQTQHSVDTSNCIRKNTTWSQRQITGKHWRKQHINTEK